MSLAWQLRQPQFPCFGWSLLFPCHRMSPTASCRVHSFFLAFDWIIRVIRNPVTLYREDAFIPISLNNLEDNSDQHHIPPTFEVKIQCELVFCASISCLTASDPGLSLRCCWTRGNENMTKKLSQWGAIFCPLLDESSSCLIPKFNKNIVMDYVARLYIRVMIVVGGKRREKWDKEGPVSAVMWHHVLIPGFLVLTFSSFIYQLVWQ